MHLDPLDEELNDPRLFGGEQLAPDRGEVGEQKCDVALADLGAPRLASAQVRATSCGAASSFRT